MLLLHSFNNRQFVTGVFNFLLAVLTLSMGNASAQTYPSQISTIIKPWYNYRKDGKPGREVLVVFKGSQLYGSATVKVEADGLYEETKVNYPKGIDTMSVLLPEGVGVNKFCQVRINVSTPQTELYQSFMIQPVRYWTIYVYPHSHVDIGYTNTQEFVRKLHVRNIDVAIDIARKTQNYPEGSRFVWNPEANWVTENYLSQATPAKRKTFIEAVKKGWISLDGDYGNINTSACTDEELLRLFHAKHQIEATTGVPIKTAVQMDVAGVSWGTVQAAYQNGIHGFFLYPNIGTVRWPWEHRPFYWQAPDGKTKIFFLQALPYGYGYDIKGSKIGLGKVQGNNPALDRITTSNPTANFIDQLYADESAKMEYQGWPYSIMVLPWALADNALIDADLPDAVKIWNEKHAWPKLIISGSQRILDDYEKRYGDILPVIKGDYSEYWTDGLGTDARRVGLYRQAPEKLVQAETAWTMLNTGKPSPRQNIDAAWENALLGAEHTWGYQNPKAPLAKQIEATKAGYFENAYIESKELLEQALRPVQDLGSNIIAVINTLSWDRDGLVTLTKDQSKYGDRVLDEHGKAVPSQRLSNGELVFIAEGVPALGSGLYTIVKGKPARGKPCIIKGNTLSNGVITVAVDAATGAIASLIDLKSGYDYVDKNSPYQLNSYRYLLESDTTNKGVPPSNIRIKVKENGPVLVSLLVESDAEGCNWLKREVTLVQGQSQIYLDNSLDKISTRTKEGIHFGFAYNIPEGNTRLDIPWGVMMPEYDQLLGGNRAWLTFQHWVDVSNKQKGVTWTSIEAPLVEFGSMTANVLGGAHGRQNWYKHTPKSQTLFSWALNNHWGTNFPLEQGGVMHFRYALKIHQGYNAIEANRFGLNEHRPLLAVQVSQMPVTNPLVKIGNPNVFISTLKQSDDGKGMILRLRSLSDKAENINLTWPEGRPHKLNTCLADEKPGIEVAGEQTILPQGTVSYYIEK